jgi:hypothetical protein
MLRTIKLDYQRFIRRTEIRKKWSDRKLPSKFDAMQSSAFEAIPYFLFGISLCTSKVARSISAQVVVGHGVPQLPLTEPELGILTLTRTGSAASP